MHDWRKKIIAAISTPPDHEKQGVQYNISREMLPVAVSGLLLSHPESVIVISADLPSAESLMEEMVTFFSIIELKRDVWLLPELEYTRGRLALESESERSRTYYQTAVPGSVFIGSVAALVVPAPDPSEFHRLQIELSCLERHWPPQTLADHLVASNYDNEAVVSQPGEFSWRGGILDVYSPAHKHPVRIEYYGDVIDSLRFFDPESQRSLQPIDFCQVIPLITPAAAEGGDGNAQFLHYFAKQPLTLIMADMSAIDAHRMRFDNDGNHRHWETLRTWPCQHVNLCTSNESPPTSAPVHELPYFPLAHLATIRLPELENSPDLVQRDYLKSHARRWAETDYDFVVCAGDESMLGRCNELLDELDDIRRPRVEFFPAALRFGMIFPAQQLVILTEAELFGRLELPARRLVKTHFKSDQSLHSGTELREGDYAVHAAYGVCRYLGLRKKIQRTTIQEALELEFDNEVRLFVPLDQIYLVSRYVGQNKALPRLSKIGGSHWGKAKAAAMTAIKDFAAELLRIQAIREITPGIAFVRDPSSDEERMTALFPFTETRDQKRAIAEVLADMEKSRPMDRLLCGDVGFGKTEVAIRAAFRAVATGKQVAVLSPTTILTQQHFLTFCQRFQQFPVLIGTLSRFSTRRQQHQVLEDVAAGKLDIVIGTHRLLQSDVVFKDLGLVIVDEEQRFGVKHKELLKKLRANVDILTMTATPIPRTLYFSLAGLRDMSVIMTAPEERLPIQTVVAQYNHALVRDAIVHELQRGGQVFYLHNRIRSITAVQKQLQELIPSAHVDIAHGRMDEADLEQVMIRFMEGRIDVLVSTTIIESGLDIANANTIIIDRADRFGLAELYQIRGRVGRYHRQAYAYLLVPEYSMLLNTARQRMDAIRKYNQLGAGFKLALRDLEIRGAGNILGAEQSGHISAIGFNLYCQLMKEAVARLKNQPAPARPEVHLNLDFVAYGESTSGQLSATISADYVADEELRLELYRKLCSVTTVDAIDGLAEEIRDRFGTLPDAIQNLLAMTKLKVAAGSHGIHTVNVHHRRVILETINGVVQSSEHRFPRLTAPSVHGYLDELVSQIPEWVSR